MFPRDYVIPRAKNVAVFLHCRVLEILCGFFSFIRLSVSINFFFVASLGLSTSLNNIK